MNVFIDKVFEPYYERYPLVLVDVGARGGVKDSWACAGRHLVVIGFEPDKEEHDKLIRSANNGSVRYLNTALHREKGKIDFHIMKKGGVSSMLRPNRRFLDGFPDSDRYDIVKTVRLEADTMDRQLGACGMTDIDFIKLDTQGSELYILEGAERALDGSVFGVEVEVEFVPTYEGQPLFADIDGFLRKRGFYLFDLQPNYWKRKMGIPYGNPKGQIIFADALYLRNPEGLGAILKNMADGYAGKAKVLRAISICLVYGYLDFAFEIFESYRDAFSDGERRKFGLAMKREIKISRRMPDFCGRGRLAETFHFLYRAIHPSHKDWACVGRRLGNVE